MQKYIGLVLVLLCGVALGADDTVGKKASDSAYTSATAGQAGKKEPLKIPQQFENPVAEELFQFMWAKGAEAVQKAEHADTLDQPGRDMKFCHNNTQVSIVSAYLANIRGVMFKGKKEDFPESVQSLIHVTGIAQKSKEVKHTFSRKHDRVPNLSKEKLAEEMPSHCFSIINIQNEKVHLNLESACDENYNGCFSLKNFEQNLPSLPWHEQLDKHLYCFDKDKVGVSDTMRNLIIGQINNHLASTDTKKAVAVEKEEEGKKETASTSALHQEKLSKK